MFHLHQINEEKKKPTIPWDYWLSEIRKHFWALWNMICQWMRLTWCQSKNYNCSIQNCWLINLSPGVFCLCLLSKLDLIQKSWHIKECSAFIEAINKMISSSKNVIDVQNIDVHQKSLQEQVPLMNLWNRIQSLILISRSYILLIIFVTSWQSPQILRFFTALIVAGALLLNSP